MTETISNANDAASTLFLGHNGEWWDFWLIISVIAAALVATSIGVTTAGSIISHKREAKTAEEALGRYKLETGKQIAEANARQKEAELQLEQLRRLASARGLNREVFSKELAGKPKAHVAIWYVPDASDAWVFSFHLQGALISVGWEVELPVPIPEPSQDTIWQKLPRAVAAGGQPSGVTLIGSNPTMELDWERDLALAALYNALVKSTNFGMSAAGNSEAMPVPKGTLRVVVAAKADPMFAPKQKQLK